MNKKNKKIKKTQKTCKHEITPIIKNELKKQKNKIEL